MDEVTQQVMQIVWMAGSVSWLLGFLAGWAAHAIWQRRRTSMHYVDDATLRRLLSEDPP